MYDEEEVKAYVHDVLDEPTDNEVLENSWKILIPLG
jgi:hypothetical protein